MLFDPNTEFGARKVKHIAANPKVALNFNTSADGGDVVMITGEAGIATAAPSPDEMAAYSIVIRVTPKHIRGF